MTAAFCSFWCGFAQAQRGRLHCRVGGKVSCRVRRRHGWWSPPHGLVVESIGPVSPGLNGVERGVAQHGRAAQDAEMLNGAGL